MTLHGPLGIQLKMKPKSKNEKYIHMCMSYTDNFSELCSLCIDGMFHDKIIQHLNLMECENTYNGFASSGWYESLKNKMNFVLQVSNSLSPKCLIGVSDVDIQYFNSEELCKLKDYFVNDNNLEYLGIHEDVYRKNEVVNGGFFILRNCQNIKNMLKTIASQDISTKPLGEQTIINEFISSKKINYKILPSNKFMKGCDDDFIKKINLNDIVMHHATNAYNIEQKKQQIQKLRKLIGLKEHNWNKEIKRNVNMILYKNGNRI